MSVYYVIFPIIIISLTLIFSGQINITYGQVNTNLTEESIENNLNGLQILSHNSFTDSIGYLHVAGEIKNNYPSTATFVRIVGIFMTSTIKLSEHNLHMQILLTYAREKRLRLY